MSTTDSIRTIARKARRFLKLSPMFKVLRELKRRGIKLDELHALEIFGYTGEFHVKDYAPYVASLEVWEIDPKCESTLKKNFPSATIKITDSLKEIKTTPKKYNFIIADLCQHYEVFPDCFRVAMDDAILVTDIIPQLTETSERCYQNQFEADELERRSNFYRTDHPKNLTFEEVIKAYEELCRANGFNMEWHFTVRRTKVYYLVMKVKRRTS